MTESTRSWSAVTPFAVFKWTVFALLALNVWLFFQRDLAARLAVSGNPDTLANDFAATIDTLSWFVLLIVFELETALLPERWRRGALRFLLATLRLACYAVILVAFSGYWGKFVHVSDLVLAGASACSLVDEGLRLAVSLDQYVPLDAARCRELGAEPLHRISGTDIVGPAETMTLLVRLALTDLVNAGTWLLVVVVLEAEVFAQHLGRLSGVVLRALGICKVILYATLFAAAVFWGLRGSFLDFWDAFLWLLAFVFIELNLFAWQAASRSKA